MKKMIMVAISFLIASLALGNYSETCKYISLESATISANCLDSQNQYIETRIRLRGVANVKGKLTFLKNTRKKSYFYKECKNVAINTEGVISAECPDAQGKYLVSSLSTNDVLVNDNGSLIYPAKKQFDFIDTCNNIRYIDYLHWVFADCLAENGGRYKTTVPLRGITVVDGKLVLTHDSKNYEELITKYCDSSIRVDDILDSEGNFASLCFENQSEAEEPSGPRLWSIVNIRSLVVNKNGSLVVVNQE